MEKIFQIKVTLNDIEPAIWRQILIKSNTKLFDFHKIIQTAMGWTNSHLHQFVYNNKLYCNPDYEDEWDDENQIDYSKLKINNLLKKENKMIVYEYDLGDGWEHTILLEKILPLEINKKLPICIAGARNCPPEDCGGSGGYEDLLNIIQNPKNDEYDTMMEWLGGDFDPEKFDIKEINKLLRKKDYGCITILD